jgi:3-oxoacyl-[acyl-carrier protein] reductase
VTEPRSPAARVVLVTGGARGIGLAVARWFVANGDAVAVTYHSTAPSAVRDADVLAVRCDVTSVEQVDAAFSAVEAELGRCKCWCPMPGLPTTGCCCA